MCVRNGATHVAAAGSWPLPSRYLPCFTTRLHTTSQKCSARRESSLYSNQLRLSKDKITGGTFQACLILEYPAHSPASYQEHIVWRQRMRLHNCVTSLFPTEWGFSEKWFGCWLLTKFLSVYNHQTFTWSNSTYTHSFLLSFITLFFYVHQCIYNFYVLRWDSRWWRQRPPTAGVWTLWSSTLWNPNSWGRCWPHRTGTGCFPGWQMSEPSATGWEISASLKIYQREYVSDWHHFW